MWDPPAQAMEGDGGGGGGSTLEIVSTRCAWELTHLNSFPGPIEFRIKVAMLSTQVWELVLALI